MPLCVQPNIRFLQAAMESNGLIQARNSVEMTFVLAQETADAVGKVMPYDSINLRGTLYTPAAAGSA